MTEKNKTFRKINKKFLKQKKFRNYELFEQNEYIKFLKHYKIYNFSQIEQIKKIREEREKQKEEIKQYIQQKEAKIKQKEERITKSQVLPNKTEFSAYDIKLFEIVNEIFDGIVSNKNLMFRPEILEELRIYLPSLVRYFTFKYYANLDLIKIEIRNLEKCIEAKQILKQLQQQQI